MATSRQLETALTECAVRAVMDVLDMGAFGLIKSSRTTAYTEAPLLHTCRDSMWGKAGYQHTSWLLSDVLRVALQVAPHMWCTSGIVPRPWALLMPGCSALTCSQSARRGSIYVLAGVTKLEAKAT